MDVFDGVIIAVLLIVSVLLLFPKVREWLRKYLRS